MNREGQEYLAKKAKEFHKKMSKKKLDLAAIPAVAFDAQRLEKERLERLVRNKKEFNDSIYTPLVINRPSTKEEENLTANGDDHLRSNCELEDEAEDNQDDDDLFIEEVIQKKPLKNVDLIELGSSEEDDEQPGTYVSKQHLPNKPALQRIHPLSQRHRLGKMHSKRKRRHSAEYDQLEMTPEGRLLINSGRPESDPDVFVAPHLTHILQPHQIGGVRFMYDNVIESLEAFEHSDGFGCILAHSMGLGKTIQAITFTEIFIRVTKRNRVAIICPVNVLQNWNNEFQQWLPKYEKQSSGSSPSEPIRDWDVFLLGDAIKTFETRVELINNWYTKGGVLLIGYEMFKLLIQPDDISTIGTSKITMVKRSKKQQMKADAERTVWELEDNLAKISDEDKRTIVRREELRQQLRQALIGPGPDLVICDEGHRIKNLNTDVASALSSIHTKRRIVLTGYPLQNNLMEYYCMIQFVRPNYLGTRRDFLYQFEKPIRNGQCIDSTKRDMKLAKQRIHVLIQLLRGFVQRRSQHLLKKILPESREYVLLLRKSPIQHALYRAFYHYSLNQAHIGEGSFNPLKGFAICMKIINHPDLLYNAVLKRNPDFGEAQNDGSIKTEEVNSGNNNDAAQNVTLNETKPEPVAEQCNLVSSSSIQQTEAEVPQQQEQQSLDIGRWNKPPPSTFQPHHPSEASYWSTTNDASSSSSTSQSAPCYPANQPPMAQPYPNRPTPMPTPAAFSQMPPPMPPYFQPNRQFFPDSLPPFPPPHFRPPPSQHPPWRHQLNQQAFDFNRFGNGNNNVYGDGNYGYSNYHQPPAQQQQQPFFSQPSNYNYFNFQPNNGIGNNYQTPRNFPAYGPYQQSMVPPPPFHPNQLHPNQHFPHHNNQQNPLHFPSSSTQLAAIGNIQPQPQSSAFNNNGAASNAAHMQNGENCGLFQGTFMDESQQQRQSQRPQQNNTKMEEQQSPESQPNHQQQQPQNNADTEEPTTITMGMENNSSPVKRTTQTPSRKRPKEPNDLLADEFIFEDNSISLEWAEPLLNSYVLGAVENSSKMLITMEIIGETVKRGEKLLLFSQSVLTLNMIESFLKKQNIVEPDGNSLLFVRNKTYCRFDGTTSGSDREKLIKRFNEDPELRLFLISTRAGSLGVNLVSANRVIIFDVSWNPCHDAQAICRIYRYGQKRKTFIYRLIMGNCMEKQVFNRQVSKQGLQKRVVDEQLVDVAITTREVENLMEYDESLDVLSTSNAFGDCVGMDDDLLKGLLEANGQWLMEEPFLHESMMLESEEGLSAEEKLEAELLFEREKNGINFPPAHEQEEVGQLGSSKLAMPAMHNPPPVPPFNFGNLLSHSSPLPKHIELAETMQQQHAQLQMQRRMAEPELVVGREMCLPRVAQGARCEPTYTLYPGQRVTGFMTIKGAYLRTKDGIILDGSSIPVGAMMPFRSHPQLSMGPRFAHKPPPNKLDQNEIIQIDD